MKIASQSAESQPGLHREGALWAGMLLPIAAWIVDEQVSAMIVPWVCATGNRTVLPLLALASLAFAVGGGLIASRAWRALPPEPLDGEPRVPARQRFMALLGMLAGGLFSVAILANAIPGLIRRPCD
jgi:hypothetical protein